MSILLLSIAIIPMVGMFDMGLKTATSSGNYDGARALAYTNLEKVRSLPYATAKVTYKPDNATPTAGTTVSCNTGIYTCGVTTTYVDNSLSANSAATTKMQVVVTVQWARGSQLYNHRAHGAMREVLKRQLLAEEKGFTLTEVLVTMMMMIVVLFALYSIFDMGMRVFSFGNNKVEAVENARLGLDKMEREMRAAYPYNKVTDNNQLFWVYNSPTTPQVPPNTPTAPATIPGPVTFGNNLNNNFQILGDEATESISYYLQNGMLMRSVNGNGQEVAGPVPAGGFEVHSYSSATGTGCPKKDSAGNLVAEAATEASINIVCVRLVINVNGRSQTLTADVALRNRGQ